MDAIDQFLQDGEQPTGLSGGTMQAPGTAPQPEIPKGFDDVDRFLNDGQAKDPLLDELIPLSMSGNTPETAMNKSPLSAQDRMKLSLGNLQGNIKYLKDRFQDVKPITDNEGNPTSNLAVFDGSTWYKVDPENGNPLDSWEATREYLHDASEFGPEAIGMLAGAGAGILAGLGGAGATVATGGAAAPAAVAGTALAAAAAGGAASAGVRTSLGRLVGTYEASPAEQAWDIGFETLLNAAGVKVMAGVKPTAKWVANKLDPVYEAFKDTIQSAPGAKAAGSFAQGIADTPKNLFKKIFASYSVGEQNFDTFLEHPQQTKAMMNAAYAQTGTNTDAYHNVVTEKQIGSIKEAVLETPRMLTNIYGAMRNQILKDTPDSFTSNLDDVLYASYGDAIDKGIGQIIVEGKPLQGAAAKEALSKVQDLSKVQFSLIPQKQLANQLANAPDIGSEASYLAHSAAYKELETYYSKLALFAGGKTRTGREGAKALLDFKKIATDIAWELESADSVKALTGIRDIIAQSRTSIDNAILNGLKQGDGRLADTFVKMNKSYNELNQEMKPVLNVVRQYRQSQNDKVFESLLQKFTSKGGKNVTEKGAFEGARATAEQYGLKDIATKIGDAQVSVRIGEAAKAFNPVKAGHYKSDMLGLSQLGMMMYAAASSNPAMIAALVGVQALRSPTTARGAAAVCQSMSKGQQMISQMSKKELSAFLSNPQAIQTFTTGVTTAPVAYIQTEQQLQQMINGQGQ